VQQTTSDTTDPTDPGTDGTDDGSGTDTTDPTDPADPTDPGTDDSGGDTTDGTDDGSGTDPGTDPGDGTGDDSGTDPETDPGDDSTDPDSGSTTNDGNTSDPNPTPTSPNNNDNIKRPTGITKTFEESLFAQWLELPSFTYQNAKDLVQWFFYQLLNDIALYNIQDCTFWAFDTLTDFLNGILLLLEENKPLDGLLSIAYSVHKAPITLFSCSTLYDDYTVVDRLVNATSTKYDEQGEYIVILFWNVVFNAADIFYETKVFFEAYDEKRWAAIGINAAKIISDIFFKSPVSPSWNYRNSDLINNGLGVPAPLIQGFKTEYNRIMPKLWKDAPLFDVE